MSEEERQRLLQLVRSAVQEAEITDENGEPADPQIWGYDDGEDGWGYEEKALAVLLYTDGLYGLMDEEIQADTEGVWESEGAQVAAKVEKKAPSVYSYVCYGVEV